MNQQSVRRESVTKILLWGVVVGGLVSVAGCGGDSGPKTVRVSGKVTYNGKPLEKGTIVFSPTDTAKGKGGTADIGAGGTFTPTTTRPGDGLVAGTYKVSVTSHAVDQINTPPAEVAKMKDGGLAIPKKFTDVGTSGLTVTVTESSKDISLELKD